MVSSGCVELFLPNDSLDSSVSQIRRGNTLGDVAIMNNSPWNVMARAWTLTACSLFSVTHKDFFEIVEKVDKERKRLLQMARKTESREMLSPNHSIDVTNILTTDAHDAESSLSLLKRSSSLPAAMHRSLRDYLLDR
jgi:CRP-like cAMP-binding protein